jgi:hypothetical protein
MTGELTMEEEFILRRMRDSLHQASQAELLDLVITAQAKIFSLAHHFREVAAGAGIATQIEIVDDFDCGLPDSGEELVQVFGGRPSTEEVERYAEERIQAFQAFHGMDIDFSDIAMEEDGDWDL